MEATLSAAVPLFQGIRAVGSAITSRRELEDGGLGASNRVDRSANFEGAIGGPFKRDKLWFFGNVHYSILKVREFKGQVSYVTGAHSFKTGAVYDFGYHKVFNGVNADLVQRYASGVPNSVAIYNTPRESKDIYRLLALYAQTPGQSDG
jgi:hypothetical protein